MPDLTETKSAWAQLPGEPSAAYTRFLIYRNLGPARTLARAQSLTKPAKKRPKTPTQVSGQWTDDAARWNWGERARAWDIATLSAVVPETATLIFSAIREMARITLEELQSGKHRPKTFDDLRESAVILSQFIAPETITAAVDHAREHGLGDNGGASASPASTDGVAAEDKPGV